MEPKKTIKRKLEYPENYEFQQVSGAFGGFTPSGKFYINFVNDEPGTPDFEIIEFDPEGNSHISFGPEKTLNLERRKVVAGFVLDEEVVFRIYKWLEKSITEKNRQTIATTDANNDEVENN